MDCLTYPNASSSPPCSHVNEESSTDVILSCATRKFAHAKCVAIAIINVPKGM